MKKRISIGHAVCTSPSGAVKCGGVVEREVRMNLGANLANTRYRTTTKMTSISTKQTEKG